MSKRNFDNKFDMTRSIFHIELSAVRYNGHIIGHTKVIHGYSYFYEPMK